MAEVRLICGEQSVSLALEPGEVRTAEGRARWIGENGRLGYLALFNQCGFVEKMSAMYRRLIAEDGGKASAQEVAQLEEMARAAEAKGL